MAWLTKSRFISGMQCGLRLWFEVHAPLDAAAPDNLQLINGRTVDSIVQDLQPGVVISGNSGLPSAIAETSRTLSQGRTRILYQPAFRAGDLAVIADVLKIRGTIAELVEIKASVAVKQQHLADAGFQTLVLRAAKMPVGKVSIGHIDNTFTLEAPGNYTGLIVEEDVTARVEALLPQIADLAAVFLRLMAAKTAPIVPMGRQCTNPSPCSFMGRCALGRDPRPKYPIDLLPGSAAAVELLATQGYPDLTKVPRDLLRNDKHRRIYDATLTGEPFFDVAATSTLREMTYPMSYLDFETIGLAVPEVVGTHPYQAVPFQWSLHIEDSADVVRHAEYLAVESFDDLVALARSLIEAIPPKGPVFAYNAAFEHKVLTDLAARIPELTADLLAISGRLVDLLSTARAAYYHRDMRGSWSLKNLLPTIAPDLAYENLGDVRDGSGAQMAFLKLRRREIDAAQRVALRSDLLDYCRRDTWGMVILRRYLCGQ